MKYYSQGKNLLTNAIAVMDTVMEGDANVVPLNKGQNHELSLEEA